MAMALAISSQINANKTKTWIIMGFFMLFFATVAYIFGHASGYGLSWAGTALVFSGLMSLGSYLWADKLVLAMHHAHEVDKEKDSELYSLVENLASTASLPMPKVYIIEDASANAFATGRNPSHAVVCVTRGLLQKLDKEELRAVLAHEISHIQNYDTRLMAIVAVLVGMIAFLADSFMRLIWWGGKEREREKHGSQETILVFLGIVLAILTPIIATLIQLAISRRREFLADASAALLTHNPNSLALALEKIASDKKVLKSATNATAHLYIVNPFKGKSFASFFSGLFNTHPPVEERIKILRSMA